MFQDFNFDWDLVKQGYADYFKRYPAATIEHEHLAELACYQGDRQTARTALASFDKPIGSFWSAEAVAQFRRWAQDDYLSGEQLGAFENTRTPQLWLDGFDKGTKWAIFDNDQHLVIWDAERGVPLNRFEVLAQVWTAAIGPTDKGLIAAEFSGRIRKVSLDTGSMTEVGKHDRLLGAGVSGDGTQFLTAGRDMTVKFWNIENGTLADTWETKPMTMEAVALSPDGKTLVTGSFDRRVTFWDRATKAKSEELPQFSTGIKYTRIARDGKLLAVLDAEQLSLWQLPAREKLAALDPPKQRVNDLAFSPDGQYLAAGTGSAVPGAQGQVMIWNTATGKLVHTYRSHKGIVRCVRFSPDGKHLVSCSDDMTIRLWKATP